MTCAPLATALDPKRPLYVAAVGDAGSPLTWSGIPYYLVETGKARGVVTAGLPLSVRGRDWEVLRAAWNLSRVACGDRIGGYQYSVGFLERLWRPHHQRVRGARVINCFQLYPPSLSTDDTVEKWHFIDLTLTQLFDYYRLRSTVGRRAAADAVERERDGYRRASGILVMSQFAAASMRDDYGVPDERVHIVVPGANLDPHAYRIWETARRPTEPSAAGLRLVIVSTDWKRKGLDRLLRAFAIARSEGLKASLKVVGTERDELPAGLAEQPGIEWVGRIYKDKAAQQFLDIVADADVGCILAHYEAGGSVLREYHALGLAAFATTAGGMPDFMFSDAAVTVHPDASDRTIADELLALAADRRRLERMQAAAWQRRREATWDASVERIHAAINGDASDGTALVSSSTGS